MELGSKLAGLQLPGGQELFITDSFDTPYMRIHTVREPFLCREGQFEEGKRSLCIGLDYQTLKKTPEFWCYLGTNKKTHYEIRREDAMTAGQTWTNKRGKTVIIVPLSVFKSVVVEPKIDEAKEKIREKSIEQSTLL